MLLVGLTGGIASGKSTVSKMLRDRGVCVIDADLLAREVVAPNEPAFAELLDAFGTSILDADQQLDRQALGRLVFSDEGARKKLEAITHPRIFERFQQRTEEAEKRGESIVVYDAPLLFERKLNQLMNAVIVVAIPRELQKQRLRSRDQMSDADAELRLASQWPLHEKVQQADHVVDNSHTLAHTEAQVDALVQQLRTRAMQKSAEGRAV